MSNTFLKGDDTMNEKLAYSVKELPEVLGISRPTAYELVHRSDFPTISVGKRILIPKAALDRWLMGQADEGGGNI